MTTITREQILKGGFFTLTCPKGESYCYEVNFLASQGKRPAKWFVRLATETESFYLGELKTSGGEIVRTNASKFAEDNFTFRLANRTFQAVMCNRIAVMEQHGYMMRAGTPNDAHEQTAHTAPVAVCETTSTRSTVDVGEVVMIQYDIPEVVSYVDGVRETNPCFPNPSGVLRRSGVRWTKSVWMFQESRTPWVLIDEMIAAGCTVDVVPVAAKATEQIIKIAQSRLVKELSDGVESMEESTKTAEANYQKAIEAGVGADKALLAYNKHMTAAAKRAESLAKDLAAAATNFGVVLTRDEIDAAIRTTMTKASTQAAAYAKAARQVQGTLFSQAASEGDMPHQVLADVLTDAGNDAAASELTAAFSGDYDLETSEPI